MGVSFKRSAYSLLPNNEAVSPSRSSSLSSGPWRPAKKTLVTLLILLTSTISGISGYLAGNRLAMGSGERLIQCEQSYIPVCISKFVVTLGQ